MPILRLMVMLGAQPLQRAGPAGNPRGPTFVTSVTLCETLGLDRRSDRPAPRNAQSRHRCVWLVGMVGQGWGATAASNTLSPAARPLYRFVQVERTGRGISSSHTVSYLIPVRKRVWSLGDDLKLRDSRGRGCLVCPGSLGRKWAVGSQ